MVENSNTILLFTTAFRPFIGGAEIAAEEVGKRIKDARFLIVTPRYFKGNRSENSGNFFIYRIGIGNIIDKFIFPVTGFLMGLYLVKKNKIKIVHAYQASFAGGAAFLLKLFIPQIRLIVTVQEGKDLDRQSWPVRLGRYLILKKADDITAISSYLADYAGKINPRAIISVIPNGIDHGVFKIAEADRISSLKDDLGIKEEEKVIITVSRLVEKNDPVAIVEAMPGVIEKIPGAKLLIAGSGVLRGYIDKRIKDLGLNDKILMLGDINYARLPEYLSIADLFVRPSLSEGLGNAFLEAMAVGLPVIGTPVGGIPDFLKDGETGFMWRKGEESLSDLIVRALNGENTAKIAARGKEFVVNNYGWEMIADKFRELYGKYE